MADGPRPNKVESSDSSSEDEFYDTLTDLSKDEGAGDMRGSRHENSSGVVFGGDSEAEPSPNAGKLGATRLSFGQGGIHEDSSHGRVDVAKTDSAESIGAASAVDSEKNTDLDKAKSRLSKLSSGQDVELQESQPESRHLGAAKSDFNKEMEDGTKCSSPGGGSLHERSEMVDNGRTLSEEKGVSGDRDSKAERTDQGGESEYSASSTEESSDGDCCSSVSGTKEGKPTPDNLRKTGSTFHEGLAAEAEEPEGVDRGTDRAADGVDGASLIEDDDGLAALEEMEKQLTEEEKEERKNQAQQLKKGGNDLYKGEEYLDAIYQYSEALKLCPLAFKKERSIMYANRAACRIHLEQLESAVKDCTKALDLHPHYMKVILRRAQTYELLEKLDEALADYQKALELDPGCHTARAACMRLPEQINERNEKMKAEMMDKLKDLGNMVLRPFGLSTNNFRMQQDPNSGSYSVNFVQNEKTNGK